MHPVYPAKITISTKGLDQWHGLMVARMSSSSAETSHRISIYFSYILRPPLEGRALHSQECFLPPRGGFNLRCTQFTSQECPLPPLEGRALHTSPSHRISIYPLERYIPKNVFFLCEEVLIYDAPSLPRKDNHFD